MRIKASFHSIEPRYAIICILYIISTHHRLAWRWMVMQRNQNAQQNACFVYHSAPRGEKYRALVPLERILGAGSAAILLGLLCCTSQHIGLSPTWLDGYQVNPAHSRRIQRRMASHFDPEELQEVEYQDAESHIDTNCPHMR